jgi:hypothetical protein
MNETINQAIQFDEVPKIDDVIKELQKAKDLGYTRIDPFIAHGDLNHTTMELQRELRIYLIK